MSTTPTFVNPFSSRPNQRRTSNAFSSKGSTAKESIGAPLELHELKAHLKKALRGDDSPHEAGFKQFLNGDNCYGYLDDKTVRDDFFKLLSKDIKTNAESLFNEDSSVLRSYFSRLGFGDNSLQGQLFKYLDAARTHTGDEPLALTDDVEGYHALRELITDPVKGLSLRAASLEELRKSDNAAIRFLVTSATEMGLGKSIEKTKKDLRTGEATAHSERLADNIDEILLKEAEALEDILPADGSLVYKMNPTSVSYVDKLRVDQRLASFMEDAPTKAFETGAEFNFGDFFKEAHRLAVQASDDQGKAKLNSHIADGLGWISAYYSASHKLAETDTEKQKLNKEFIAISDTIQGRALLPKRLSSIIQEAANLAVFSTDFTNNFSLANEDGTSKEVLEFFFDNFPTSDNGMKPGVSSIVDGAGRRITVFHPETGNAQTHQIRWIDDADTKEGAQSNRDLSPGKPLSLERAVRSYQDIVDANSRSVLGTLEKELPTGLGNTQSRAEALQQIESSLNTNQNSIGDLTTTISKELQNLSTKSLINRDFDAIKKALKKYVDRSLTKHGSTKNLWQNPDKSPSSMQTALNGLATAILTGTDIDRHTNEFTMELHTRIGRDNEPYLIDNRATARTKELLTSLVIKQTTSKDLGDTLDLNERSIRNIFNTNSSIGRALFDQLASENLDKVPASQILANPYAEESGELAHLLFAVEDGQIDHGKRTAALIHLAKQVAANTTFSREEVLDHIADKTGRTTEAKTQVYNALEATANTIDSGNIIFSQRIVNLLGGALDTVRHMAFMRKSQDTQRTIKYFGDQKGFNETARASLANLSDQIDRISQEDNERPIHTLIDRLDSDGTAKFIVNQFCFPQFVKDPLGTSTLGEDPYLKLRNLQDLIHDLL